jgi:hypothetical protein
MTRQSVSHHIDHQPERANAIEPSGIPVSTRTPSTQDRTGQRPAARTLRRSSAMVTAAFVVLAGGDILGSVNLGGGISLSAAITILAASRWRFSPSTGFVILRNSHDLKATDCPPHGRSSCPGQFAITALNGRLFDLAALQNLSVYMLFVGAMLMSSRANAVDRHRLLRLVKIAIILRASLYALDLARSGFGASGILYARAFGIVGVLLLALLAFAPRRPFDRALGGVLFAQIIASGSRTAMAASGIIIAVKGLAARRGSRVLRTAVVASLVGGLSWLLLRSSGDLQDRFFSGDTSFGVGGVALNASGRSLIWETVTSSASERPWTGWGPVPRQISSGTSLSPPANLTTTTFDFGTTLD